MNDVALASSATEDSKLPAQTQGAALAAASAGATALQQAMFAVAASKPRDLDRFRQQMIVECRNYTFADKAVYKVRYGGEEIRDASIRFAEGVARHFENFGIDCVIASDTPTVGLRPGFVVIRNVLIDYERRRIWTDEVAIEKTVERSYEQRDRPTIAVRFNADGQSVYIVPAWPHEMLAKINAAKSKSQRNLILKLIDQALLDEFKAEIKKTCVEKANRDPDVARKQMIDGFADVGVPVEELARYVGQDLGTLSPAQVVDLRELWTGIDEGACTWADALADKGLAPANGAEPGEAPAATESLLDRLRARREAGSKSEPSATSSAPQTTPASQTKPEPKTETATAPAQTTKPARDRKILIGEMNALLRGGFQKELDAAIKKLGKSVAKMSDAELESVLKEASPEGN